MVAAAAEAVGSRVDVVDVVKVCIEKYLLSGGVTAEEIETFRKAMLVK